MTLCNTILDLLVVSLMVGSVAHADVYLTKEQALQSVFGFDCEQSYDPKVISPELKKKLLTQGLWGEEKENAHFFLCTQSGVVTAYALIDSEVGKHLPLTYVVGISPSGVVTKVELMVFREIRGWEVREKRFMAQFEEKTRTDKIEIGETISNVSGATLSAQAMTKGVRRALVLWHDFYGIRH